MFLGACERVSKTLPFDYIDEAPFVDESSFVGVSSGSQTSAASSTHRSVTFQSPDSFYPLSASVPVDEEEGFSNGFGSLLLPLETSDHLRTSTSLITEEQQLEYALWMSNFDPRVNPNVPLSCDMEEEYDDDVALRNAQYASPYRSFHVAAPSSWSLTSSSSTKVQQTFLCSSKRKSMSSSSLSLFSARSFLALRMSLQNELIGIGSDCP